MAACVSNVVTLAEEDAGRLPVDDADAVAGWLPEDVELGVSSWEGVGLPEELWVCAWLDDAALL